MIKLTLDTNIIRDMLDPARADHEDAIKLLELHKSGGCEIRVTSRLKTDIPGGPLREKVDALPVLEKSPDIGGPFRLDVSFLDGPDMLVDNLYVDMGQQMMGILFPGSNPTSAKHRNRLADIDHLTGHKMNDRDVFLTREEGILKQKKALLDNFNIKVMSTTQFFEDLELSA